MIEPQGEWFDMTWLTNGQTRAHLSTVLKDIYDVLQQALIKWDHYYGDCYRLWMDFYTHKNCDISKDENIAACLEEAAFNHIPQ